jgi:hypothetical protein
MNPLEFVFGLVRRSKGEEESKRGWRDIDASKLKSRRIEPQVQRKRF